MMFGIRLPINFYSPYKSSSVIEFWRRWHVSLSRFLRDYLYIPLGGNRKGPSRRYANLLITMILGGLWHGAGWTFVVWGAYHGVLLLINHAWRSNARAPLLGEPVSVAITFVAVVLGWVMFKADSLSTARAMYQAMFGMSGMHGLFEPDAQAWVQPAGCLIGIWLLPNSYQIFARYRPGARRGGVDALAFAGLATQFPLGAGVGLMHRGDDAACAAGIVVSLLPVLTHAPAEAR